MAVHAERRQVAWVFEKPGEHPPRRRAVKAGEERAAELLLRDPVMPVLCAGDTGMPARARAGACERTRGCGGTELHARQANALTRAQDGGAGSVLSEVVVSAPPIHLSTR